VGEPIPHKRKRTGMSDANTPVEALKSIVHGFARERDWEPYHSPKNLVMAIASEVGELVEPFRWLTEDESRRFVRDDAVFREAVADEMADVFTLLLQLSVHTGIDLSDALRAKVVKNAVKYPAPAKKGSGVRNQEAVKKKRSRKS
jgi:NTP pyrophosphatase (non-canonical NTP hydrolase)